MKKVLFFVLAAASLASCKKENNNSGGTPPPPGPAPAAKMLKKFTETANGVATVYNVTYNGNKQLVMIKSADNADVTNFTYDGAGNVTKLESRDAEFHNVYEYAYQNGVPASATFKSYQIENGQESLIEDDILKYTVAANKVMGINLNLTMAGQEMDFALSYDNGGNLSKIQSEGSDFFTATFTYGNKKPVFPNVFKFVLDHAGYSLFFFAKNELIARQFDFPGTDLDHSDAVQYTYDAAGYVLTSKEGNVQTTFEYQ